MEIVYLVIGLILFLWAGVVLHIASEKLESAKKIKLEAQEAFVKALEVRQSINWPVNPPETAWRNYDSKGHIV